MNYSIDVCMDLSKFLNMSHLLLQEELHFLPEFIQILLLGFSSLHLLKEPLLEPLQPKSFLPNI